MKIRAAHPILDRIKVIIILMCLIMLLGKLAECIEDKKDATIQKLLQVAFRPVGTTMYVWGGGWPEEDKDLGGTSSQIGLSKQWKKFAKQQNEAYDFREHRFERENGLDCSGYVAWVIYNTFERKDGKNSYLTVSTELAENYANRGWGELLTNPITFLPGDIVSMEGHVWICLGSCADGSILLAHSSPPGVTICGTIVEEGKESIAIKLATEYMSKYYPKWQNLYPNRMVPKTYLENVSVLRWNDTTMSDAKELQRLSAEEILRILTTSEE